MVTPDEQRAIEDRLEKKWSEAFARENNKHVLDRKTLQDALEDVVYQFAYRGKMEDGGLSIWTGGLGALELAFRTLGWPDPKPYPEGECESEGCHEEATCGTPTPTGYKRLCGKHCQEVSDATPV